MQRRRVLLNAALSPYAQALKHVALKGSVALGPSVKEEEIEMYMKGELPADYKPPVHGKWDDTIERWAYAWQYPTETNKRASLSGHRVRTKLDRGQEQLLLNFAERLIGSSYSTVPGSGRTATSAMAEEEPVLIDAAQEEKLLAMLNEEPATGAGGDEDNIADMMAQLRGETAPAPEATQQLQQSNDEDIDALAATLQSVGFSATLNTDVHAEGHDETKPSTFIENFVSNDYSRVTPAVEYSRMTNVPVAYIDDGSELAVKSKELGELMITELNTTYDARGAALCIRNLAINGHDEAARALLEFIKAVGLHPGHQEDRFYVALMSGMREVGNVDGAMSVIEEMKEEGITPTIQSWHSLMMTCYNAGDFGAVQQVVENMTAFASIEPDEATFYIQLMSLARDRSRMSSPFEAIQLFDQMENVYNFLPSRRHYHALLEACCHKGRPDLVQKVDDTAKKMELLGITWDSRTGLLLMASARSCGDVKKCKSILAKLRNNNVPVHLPHMQMAIECHMIAMKSNRAQYDAMKETTPLEFWIDNLTVVYGIMELVVNRKWTLTANFLNSIYKAVAEAAVQCLNVTPDDTESLMKFEDQCEQLWTETYDQFKIEKNVQSYDARIAMLARLNRIDEAEKEFQTMVLNKNMTPSTMVYQELMYMHIRSGEEGGTARALQYMDAMERAGLQISPRLVKSFVDLNNEAGYKRDMKRRARRIMQAREEYMAKKAEGVDMTPKPYTPPTHDDEGNPQLVPLPVSTSSTLAWWDKWKRESASKHELFETEREDGLPRGEDFAEKNEALAKMGIDSKFLTVDDVPQRDDHHLLRATNKEFGTGALWAMDGEELSYPSDGQGPDGWGVALWRQRQVMRKEFAKIMQGKAEAPPLTAAGNSIRVVPDQLAVEESGASTQAQLSDFRKYPEHVYDDGKAKPASEMAAPVPPGGELVWQQERTDKLAAFKTSEELSLEQESGFFDSMEKESKTKIDQTISILKNKEENMTELTASKEGVMTKKGKYDYLAKWREMYSEGTLEAPDEPVLRFGTTPVDHEETVAKTIQAWYGKQSQRHAPSGAPMSDEDAIEAKKATRRHRENLESVRSMAAARKKSQQNAQRRHNKKLKQHQYE